MDLPDLLELSGNTLKSVRLKDSSSEERSEGTFQDAVKHIFQIHKTHITDGESKVAQLFHSQERNHTVVPKCEVQVSAKLTCSGL